MNRVETECFMQQLQAYDNCPVCINTKQDMGKDNSPASAGETYGKTRKHIINVWTVVIKIPQIVYIK